MAGAQRPRAGRSVPAGRDDHGPRRQRHLPGRVQGQARPDDGGLPRHDPDHRARRRRSPRHDGRQGQRQARAGRRERDDPQRPHRARRRHAGGLGHGSLDHRPARTGSAAAVIEDILIQAPARLLGLPGDPARRKRRGGAERRRHHPRRRRPRRPRAKPTCTTVSVLRSGSRNHSSGGTPGKRLTSASTSTPASLSARRTASMSPTCQRDARVLTARGDVRAGRAQRDRRVGAGGGDLDPAARVAERRVDAHLEAERVGVEAQRLAPGRRPGRSRWRLSVRGCSRHVLPGVSAGSTTPTRDWATCSILYDVQVRPPRPPAPALGSGAAAAARRRREPLTQEAIVEAALEVLDADGLDLLSMRHVARTLNAPRLRCTGTSAPRTGCSTCCSTV